MALIKNGTYRAKIKDYGFGAQREGKADYAFVQFDFMGIQWDEATGSEVEAPCSLTWFGYLKSEKSIEITTETMQNTFGLDTTPQKLKVFNGGIGKGGMDEAQEYDLEVENETYEGKTKAKIKYVNKPGQTRTLQRLADQDVDQFVAGIAGHFMNRANSSATQPPQQQYQQPAPVPAPATTAAPQPRPIANLPNHAPVPGGTMPPPTPAPAGFESNEKIPF